MRINKYGMKYIKTYESLFKVELDNKVLKEIWLRYFQLYTATIVFKIGKDYYRWSPWDYVPLSKKETGWGNFNQSALGFIKDHTIPFEEVETFQIYIDPENNQSSTRNYKIIDGNLLREFYEEVRSIYPEIEEAYIYENVTNRRDLYL